MAITYDGTAITSATWDGTTYKNISYKGCVAYSNTCLCHFTDMSPSGYFGGFERKTCSGCYYLRAKYWLCPYANGCTCLCWVGGKLANCYDDLQMDAMALNYLSCTCLIIRACGSICGNIYSFPITHAPIGLGNTTQFIICSCDCEVTCPSIAWYGGSCYCMYSDWVRVCYCDYMYGTISFSAWNIICHPKFYTCAIRYYHKGLNGVGCASDVQIQDKAGTSISGIATKVLC